MTELYRPVLEEIVQLSFEGQRDNVAALLNRAGADGNESEAFARNLSRFAGSGVVYRAYRPKIPDPKTGLWPGMTLYLGIPITPPTPGLSLIESALRALQPIDEPPLHEIDLSADLHRAIERVVRQVYEVLRSGDRASNVRQALGF